MLLIKTIVKESTLPGAGLGLFADEDIKKGTTVWKFKAEFDEIITDQTLSQLSESAKEQCLHYAYLDLITNHLILCGDDERFINHSETPNILQARIPEEPEGIEIAARDIKKGEELFCNYYDFDAYAADKLKDIR